MQRITTCLSLTLLFAFAASAAPIAVIPQHETQMRVPGAVVPESPATDDIVWLDNFEADPPGWSFYDPANSPSHWATNGWHSFDGNNWRCFDPNVGNPATGGYENDWLDFLVSPALDLSVAADSIIFNFWFRAYAEDGNWDGANVWVFYSDTPGAVPEDCQREIITPTVQSPQYTETNVRAFELWMPDPGPFPAWAGEGTEPFCTTWTEARFLLNAYAAYATVYVAVAFGSDTAYDSFDNPDMFGLQVDNLKVEQDYVTLWFEDGDGGNIGGDPSFLTRSTFSGNQPISLQIYDNAANAYSPTHYLGVEDQIVGMQDQYAESPEFSLPELNTGESLWLDLWMAIDLEYSNNFPDEFYWRPEIYNPTYGEWMPPGPNNYVYVGGTNGEWTQFSQSNYTWDWDISSLAGLDGVKVRIWFHSPETPRDFSFFRIDDIFIEREGIYYDVMLNFDVPYPTTVGVPVHGEVFMKNFGPNPTPVFHALWALNGTVFPLIPSGPFTMEPDEELDLDIYHPATPGEGWLPLLGDIGENHLSAYHTLDDPVPSNNEFPVDIYVSPPDQFEMGCDSRSYFGSLSVTPPNDGPVVHLVPDEINPDFFAGMMFNLEMINFFTFFHSAAGGAPPNASMMFHVFAGGPTPQSEIFTGEYFFDVDPGYLGEYMVNFDVSDVPELQNLTGDFWIWAEITEEAQGGYFQPFPYRTNPNDMQTYQFFDLQDAVDGNFIEDFGHHLTATISAVGTMPDVSVNITPLQVEVPVDGGSIFYGLDIASHVNHNIFNLNYWIDVTGPNGGVQQAYRTATFSTWPFREIHIASVENAVPGWLPHGVYTVEANVGFYPDAISTDVFHFVKGPFGSANGVVTEWRHQVLDFAADEPVETELLPTEFRVGSIAPNPFNPNATLSIDLPEVSKLEVTVMNVLGQQVAKVASGTFTAGNHHLIIDGSSLASGVYFVYVTVPGKMNEMRKIILMK